VRVGDGGEDFGHPAVPDRVGLDEGEGALVRVEILLSAKELGGCGENDFWRGY
jgi:hypothetical protein